MQREVSGSPALYIFLSDPNRSTTLLINAHPDIVSSHQLDFSILNVNMYSNLRPTEKANFGIKLWDQVLCLPLPLVKLWASPLALSESQCPQL